MRISFDLDNTLIYLSPEVPLEPNRIPSFLRSTFNEPLRLGFCRLAKELVSQGWQICIYTTSARPAWQVRVWLWFYGVKVVEVINLDRHQAVVGKTIQPTPSKHPPSFGIQLHVDDSELVALESKRYRFACVIVSSDDPNWVEAVLSVANKIESAKP